MEYLDFYKKLYLVRRCEEKIQEEYFNDEMKTPVHLAIGAEAIAVGALMAFDGKKQVFGTYRNHALYLTLSEDLDGFYGELYGKVTGCAKGKAGSMHMMIPEKGLLATSAVVATTIPVAVGAALANKMKGNDDTVLVFFGDGATEEGAFWESVNFASLHKLNIVFVCEDNELAIHALPDTRRGFKSFEKIADTFGCSFVKAPGYRIQDVFEATSSLKQLMKQNPGPGFCHFEYFRTLEHVGPQEDFKFGYREAPNNYKKNLDPVWNLENEMMEAGIDFQHVKKEISERVDEAVKKAQAAPFPEISELMTDVLI